MTDDQDPGRKPELEGQEKAVGGQPGKRQQQDLQPFGIRIDHIDASQILVNSAAVIQNILGTEAVMKGIIINAQVHAPGLQKQHGKNERQKARDDRRDPPAFMEKLLKAVAPLLCFKTLNPSKSGGQKKDDGRRSRIADPSGAQKGHRTEQKDRKPAA